MGRRKKGAESNPRRKIASDMLESVKLIESNAKTNPNCFAIQRACLLRSVVYAFWSENLFSAHSRATVNSSSEFVSKSFSPHSSSAQTAYNYHPTKRL